MFGEFKEAMTKEFEMTDIGLMAYYLGIEVNQREDGSFISQAGYAREILKKFRMDNSKSINTPVECGVKLSKHDEEEKVDPTFFKSLVGSLRYLTCTRPDIFYVVGLVSGYMEDPTTIHLKIAKRILRYIKGQPFCKSSFFCSQDIKPRALQASLIPTIVAATSHSSRSSPNSSKDCSSMPDEVPPVESRLRMAPSRGRLEGSAAGGWAEAAPERTRRWCCWRSRRLAAGTHVLRTWVAHSNPRLLQQVRHRRLEQSFFAWLPQSWQLIPPPREDDDELIPLASWSGAPAAPSLENESNAAGAEAMWRFCTAGCLTPCCCCCCHISNPRVMASVDLLLPPPLPLL
ncbi:hypothetical protein ZIOFF_005896 [Zingiber officinale]|uniref:Reverse transcriptase Ty1/copia-type domain-containing protein n=1 Tax=Zingiber officinale TaxID=94328 RepID=A0A8J5HRG1_ZINOF|nr:hypothetical protein ZIOFF_005896 [Zingiber officinale]